MDTTERDRLVDASSCEDVDSREDSSSESLNETKRKLMGFLLALAVVGLTAAAIVAVQLLNGTVPQSELNGLRFCGTLIACAMFAMCSRRCDVTVGNETRGWLLLATLVNTLSNYAMYGQVDFLPVGTASGVYLSLTVILNNVVSIVVHKSLRSNEIVASTLCIIGVLLTSQPKALFHHLRPSILHVNLTFSTPCLDNQYTPYVGLSTTVNQSNASFSSPGADPTSTHKPLTGYILCVVQAVTDVTLTNVIRYRMPEVDILSMSFWMGVVGVVTSFTVMSFMETPAFPRAPFCIGLVAVHMLFSGTGSFVYARSAQLISPVWLCLFELLRIPLLFTLQYTLLTGLYPGYGNVTEIVGVVILLVGNVIIPATELVKWRDKSPCS